MPVRLRHLLALIFVILVAGCSTIGDNCKCDCRGEPECPIDRCANPCSRPKDCGPTVEQLMFVTKGSKCMGYNPRLDLQKRGGQIIEIGANAIIILPNDLLFELGCPTFREGSYPLLNALAAFLRTYCYVPLYISGHSDNVASSCCNCWISDAQAQLVQAYLWTRGYHFKRLSATGCGDYKPIANQLTVKGNAANRRIEIRIRRACC